MTHALDLLQRMAGLLRSGEDWARIHPAPVFDAAPALPVVTPPALPPQPPARAPAEVFARIEALEPRINAFTAIYTDAVAKPGPLAGLPFAAKDLFDVAGFTTLAGSIARREAEPATADATAVARLRAAGALLAGATNMDEGAYGFTTENSHYGATHNPHDLERVAGGSSGGSAAAVAAGMVDAALGTDTNGSIRIPAAFCGIYGLRPTYGLVPRTGSVLFAPSLDAVGVLARTIHAVALVLDAIAGPDGIDPACVHAAPESYLDAVAGERPLRVASVDLAGWGAAAPDLLDATDRVATALGATETIVLPDAGLARAAAIVVTAAEGADQQQELLRAAPEIVDVRVRDRFLAGLEVPATDYLAAQRFRRRWQERILPLLLDVDILVLPTVAAAAPRIDQAMLPVGDEVLPTGAVLGRFTQPLSFIGLPTLSVPLAGPDGLPLGVQLAAKPFHDGTLLAAAAALEAAGVVGAVTPREEPAWT
jgi:AtzE family amidohydrolase